MRRHLFGFLLAALPLVGCQTQVGIDRNDAPVAHAGTDMQRAVGERVLLDGRASYDVDGDVLNYHWTVDRAPLGSQLPTKVQPFSVNHSDDAATAAFRPDVPGTYIISLRTDDSKRTSEPAYVIVTVEGAANLATPTVRVEGDTTVGERVQLIGSVPLDGSEPDVQYAWTVVLSPDASDVKTLSDDHLPSASFVPDVAGTYGVALQVNMPGTAYEPALVLVHVTGANQAPVSEVVASVHAEDCSVVDQLDCSGSSDPDGDELSYWWAVQAVPDGSSVDGRSLSDPESATPEIFFDIAGDYTLACSVFDGQLWSKPSTVTVSVDERAHNTAPELDVGPDQIIDAGEVTCTTTTMPSWPFSTITECESCPAQDVVVGDSAIDADGDPMVLEWTVIRDSHVSLVGATDGVQATVRTPKIQPTRTGVTTDISYARLSATDCTGEVSRQDVEVTSECVGL